MIAPHRRHAFFDHRQGHLPRVTFCSILKRNRLNGVLSVHAARQGPKETITHVLRCSGYELVKTDIVRA
jgi:hypothetical protein